MSIAFPSLPSIPPTFFQAAYQTFDTYSSYLLTSGQTLLDKGRPLFGRIYPIALPIAFVVVTVAAIHFYFKQEQRLRNLEERLNKLEPSASPSIPPLSAPEPASLTALSHLEERLKKFVEEKFKKLEPSTPPPPAPPSASLRTPPRRAHVSPAGKSTPSRPRLNGALTNELVLKSKNMESKRGTTVRLSPKRQPRMDDSTEGKLISALTRSLKDRRTAFADRMDEPEED